MQGQEIGSELSWVVPSTLVLLGANFLHPINGLTNEFFLNGNMVIAGVAVGLDNEFKALLTWLWLKPTLQAEIRIGFASFLDLVYTQAVPTFQPQRHREFDYEIGDALSRNNFRGIFERLALLGGPVGDLILVVQPGRTQNGVVKVRRLDDACCLAMRVQDAAVALPGDFVVGTHQADKNQALNTRCLHGSAAVPRKTRHSVCKMRQDILTGVVVIYRPPAHARTRDMHHDTIHLPWTGRDLLTEFLLRAKRVADDNGGGTLRNRDASRRIFAGSQRWSLQLSIPNIIITLKKASEVRKE